jgi:transcriptional regulator with XRE-family HTH domain
VPVPTRRPELAAFLRSRRERITPDEVGLPPGPRRRTPGLRREEVALLSAVGTTWYTWLEQGRPINPSAQVLDAIARTLRLDATEQAHLHHLAGVASFPAAEPTTAPDVQVILDALAPLPACVLDARYTVLAWNEPYAVLWRRTLAAPPGERNVLWQCFTIPACCSPFGTDRDAELRRLVAAFRTDHARHLGDPRWDELIARLAAASPEFAALWRDQDVQAPATRVKRYRHAAVGDIAMSVTDLDLRVAPDLRITVYTPVDDESRRRVDWLLAHPTAPPADHDHG